MWTSFEVNRLTSPKRRFFVEGFWSRACCGVGEEEMGTILNFRWFHANFFGGNNQLESHLSFKF